MPCNCSNAGQSNGQVVVGGNGSSGTFPPVPEPRPTLEEIRYLLRGYDELGILLPDAAILTNADGEVDQIRVETLYVNDINCLDTGCSLFNEQWTNTAPITATVGGILQGTQGSTLVGDTAITILEKILYAFQPATISAFTIPFSFENSIGDSVGGTNSSFNFSFTNSSNISNPVILSYSANGGSFTTIAILSNTDTSYVGNVPVFTSLNPGYFVSFRLRATQTNPQYANAEQIRTIYWWSNLYYGKSADPASVDYRLFDSGSSSRINTLSTKTQEVEVDAGEGYVYFFIHSSRQITSIFQGPLNVTSAFFLQGTETVSGIQYKIYRSSEILNSSLNFTVNSDLA